MCQPGRPSPTAVCQTRLAFLARLPEHEIARVVLVVFVDIHPGAGADAAEVVVRELAVFGKIGDPVIHRALGLDR